jgi:hypothetical protein
LAALCSGGCRTSRCEASVERVAAAAGCSAASRERRLVLLERVCAPSGHEPCRTRPPLLPGLAWKELQPTALGVLCGQASWTPGRRGPAHRLSTSPKLRCVLANARDRLWVLRRPVRLTDERFGDLDQIEADDSYGDVGGVRIQLFDAGAGRVQSPSSSRQTRGGGTTRLPLERRSEAATASDQPTAKAVVSTDDSSSGGAAVRPRTSATAPVVRCGSLGRAHVYGRDCCYRFRRRFP